MHTHFDHLLENGHKNYGFCTILTKSLTAKKKETTYEINYFQHKTFLIVLVQADKKNTHKLIWVINKIFLKKKDIFLKFLL